MALLTVIAPASALADERLLDYGVMMELDGDGTLLVRESIRVRAEMREIRRGIFREFPLDNVQPYQPHVPYEVVSVERDAAAIDYFSERRGRAFRVYLGSGDALLPGAGEYRYELIYRVPKSVVQSDLNDSLEWNAIPFFWVFPIDRAEVTVLLPPGFDALSMSWVSGGFGTTANQHNIAAPDVDRTSDGRQRIYWQHRTTLPPKNGMTLAIAMSPDLIPQPYPERSGEDGLAGWLMAAPPARLLLPALFLILGSGAMYWIWHRVGRDPKPRTVFPRYFPPEDLSPAATQYLFQLGESDGSDLIITALLSAASKGVILLDQDEDENLSIRRQVAGNDALSPGEAALLQRLLGSDRMDAFYAILNPKTHSTETALLREQAETLREARSVLRETLDAEVGATYVSRVRLAEVGVWFCGVGALLAGLLSVFNSMPGPFDNGLIFFVPLIWSLLFSCLPLALVIWIVRRVAGDTIWSPNSGAYTGWHPRHWIVLLAWMFSASGLHLFVLSVFFAPATGFHEYAGHLGASFYPVLMTLGMLLLTRRFAWMVHSPTVAGAERIAELKGLRMYIAAAEHQDLASLEPGRTPERFTALYPYAFALDLELEWASVFSEELKRWSAEHSPGVAWYFHSSGLQGANGGGALGSTFSAGLASAVTAGASYSPPGSGGGVSGGGGGGCGGGF